MADFTDNSSAVLSALDAAVARALETIGQNCEGYASELAPVKTGALRLSITHRVAGDTVIVGSNLKYAPYVELGTGKEYQPPPEWMENNAPRGKGVITGVKPRPYLRPAVINHVEEYKDILKNELKNA